MAQQSIHDSPSSCGTASQSDQMLDTEKKACLSIATQQAKEKSLGEKETDGARHFWKSVEGERKP